MSLPHFGISEELQARLEWIEWQQRSDRFGTTSYPSSFDIPDPALGWRVRPNANVKHVKPGVYEVSVKTNAFGLRGTYPYSLNKAHGTLRVGVFGDSQTFGETVSDGETYIALLNRRLDNAEIINFGVRGYGTDQMLLYLEQEAQKYNLDIVVLATAFYHMRRNVTSFLFYAKPQFNLLDDGQLRLSGIPVPDPEKLRADTIAANRWPLMDQSVLLRWSWQRIRNLRKNWLFSANGEGWRLMRALISRFVKSAGTLGASVVLVNIDEGRPELEDDLQGLANDLSVKLVDLGPVLREAGGSGVDYAFPNDAHWTPEGHAIVAGALYSALSQEIGIADHCKEKNF